jgi:hypothetical protein
MQAGTGCHGEQQVEHGGTRLTLSANAIRGVPLSGAGVDAASAQTRGALDKRRQFRQHGAFIQSTCAPL